MSRKKLMGIGIGILAVAAILACYAVAIDYIAGRNAEKALSEMELSSGTKDWELNPDIPMPTTRINGKDYIGRIELPSIDICLPVLSEYKQEDLTLAPCRYKGSAYSGDLIIAAHAYDTHFGRIRGMAKGDAVIFTDVEGHKLNYGVAGTEIIPGTDVKRMSDGEWDMTLFTCTFGGQNRCAVRCVRI